MKKLAALVLVLIMCFSVSIGGTYAVQLGNTGKLASDVFVAEDSVGATVEIAENKRVKLVPDSAVNGEAIRITTGDSAATVTIKFTVPEIFDNDPLIKVTVTGDDWTKNEDETFSRTIDGNTVTLEDFNFTLDSRVDVVDGKVCTVVNGEIGEINWKGLEKGYVRIDVTTAAQGSSPAQNT